MTLVDQWKNRVGQFLLMTPSVARCLMFLPRSSFPESCSSLQTICCSQIVVQGLRRTTGQQQRQLGFCPIQVPTLWMLQLLGQALWFGREQSTPWSWIIIYLFIYYNGMLLFGKYPIIHFFFEITLRLTDLVSKWGVFLLKRHIYQNSAGKAVICLGFKNYAALGLGLDRVTVDGKDLFCWSVLKNPPEIRPALI